MTRLNWHDTNARFYETGLDRGVFYPPTGPAVPWNGLTNVNESGSESQVTYYIDGQVFLHLPTRKAFKANLRAFTYPDEFAEVMGLAEATDGFYVDSQQGVPFDLSYRTLVGNAALGTQAGYKIHLIYNATVAPQGTEYNTLGGEVNPVDFEWEIDAVPEKLTGYHPSAHFIIDTRHLDKQKMDAIEELLYGSETETPQRLPKPDVIFEVLKYDDQVIIVDNGDGTWTATGKYVDVIQNMDGSFVLHNADATFINSGTYYFGDTPPGGVPTGLDGGSTTTSGPPVTDGGSPNTGGGEVTDGGSP